MRLVPAVLLLSIIFASNFDSSNCQLRFGANGLRMIPPINVATIFRILKRTWNALINPTKKKSSVKKGRGVSKAENRMGEGDHFKDKEQIIAELSEEEKLILNELKIKVKISCYSHNLDCNKMTMNNYISATNGSLTEAERNATVKLTESPSLDFQVSELVDTRFENMKPATDESNLEKAPKTPTLWPYPFASGGWLMSYVIVNSILMGLYIFLSWPYFLTGRVIDRIVKSDDEAETTTSRGTMSKAALDEMQQYMGYTSYGDSDMFMSYMMSEDGDEKKNGETTSEAKNNEEKGNGEANSSGETRDAKEANEETMEDKSAEQGKYTNTMMKDNKEPNDDKSKETEEDNKIKDDKDEHTKCIESIMCLRPVYGARALSSASLALNLLEWLTGSDSIGTRFKRNAHRFGRAIEKGRINDCYDYVCPKDKPTS